VGSVGPLPAAGLQQAERAGGIEHAYLETRSGWIMRRS
jgi:hypothetical protein